MMSVLEVNCTTNEVRIRPITEEERALGQQDFARAEAARAAKEAEEQAKQAEREALSAWLLSREDLTDGARAAILRAISGPPVAETAPTV